MHQDAFDALLMSMKSQKRKRRVQPFRKRQQVAFSYESSISNVATEQTTSVATAPA
ncbi:hypothetical protein AYI68_g2254, partial [Smittium mucronatum]